MQDFDPVLAAFRIFDRDHSGYLTGKEISAFVSQMPGVGKVRSLQLRDAFRGRWAGLGLCHRSFRKRVCQSPPAWVAPGPHAGYRRCVCSDPSQGKLQ